MREREREKGGSRMVGEDGYARPSKGEGVGMGRGWRTKRDHACCDGTGGTGVREGEREGKSTREESTEQERGWEGGGPQSIDPPWRRR